MAVKVQEENRSLKADVKKLKDELASSKQSEPRPRAAPGPQEAGASARGCCPSHVKVLVADSPSGPGAG